MVHVFIIYYVIVLLCACDAFMPNKACQMGILFCVFVSFCYIVKKFYDNFMSFSLIIFTISLRQQLMCVM